MNTHHTENPVQHHHEPELLAEIKDKQVQQILFEDPISNIVSTQIYRPKTGVSLTIIAITSLSCLLGLLLLSGTITLLVGDALFWFEIEGGGVYLLMVAMAALLMIVGGMTFMVGVRMWKGDYLVNEFGHVLNSKGKRINILGGLETRSRRNSEPILRKEINVINI